MWSEGMHILYLVVSSDDKQIFFEILEEWVS